MPLQAHDCLLIGIVVYFVGRAQRRGSHLWLGSTTPLPIRETEGAGAEQGRWGAALGYHFPGQFVCGVCVCVCVHLVGVSPMT